MAVSDTYNRSLIRRRSTARGDFPALNEEEAASRAIRSGCPSWIPKGYPKVPDARPSTTMGQAFTSRRGSHAGADPRRGDRCTPTKLARVTEPDVVHRMVRCRSLLPPAGQVDGGPDEHRFQPHPGPREGHLGRRPRGRRAYWAWPSRHRTDPSRSSSSTTAPPSTSSRTPGRSRPSTTPSWSARTTSTPSGTGSRRRGASGGPIRTSGSPGEINHEDGGRGLYWQGPDGHWLEIITRPYGSGA